MQDSYKIIPFCTQVGVEIEFKPRTTTLSFGDGYEQRIGGGINLNMRNINASYKLKRYDMQILIDFLKSHAGYKPFRFEEPYTSETLLVVCKSWKAMYSNNRGTLTAQFEEVAN